MLVEVFDDQRMPERILNMSARPLFREQSSSQRLLQQINDGILALVCGKRKQLAQLEGTAQDRRLAQ